MGLHNDENFNYLYNEEFEKIPGLFRFGKKKLIFAVVTGIVSMIAASIFLILFYDSGYNNDHLYIYCYPYVRLDNHSEAFRTKSIYQSCQAFQHDLPVREDKGRKKVAGLENEEPELLILCFYAQDLREIKKVLAKSKNG